MLNSAIHKRFTLSDLLDEGESSEITIDNVTITELVNDKKIPIKNLMVDYLDIIKNGSVMVELTDKELETYRFNTKKLSYALYGTVELYFIILLINGMYSNTQFNKKKIMVFDKKNNYILDQIFQNIRDYKEKKETTI